MSGGCSLKTEPMVTTHQMVTDVSRRQVWLKVPNPKYLTDWTHVDLTALFA